MLALRFLTIDKPRHLIACVEHRELFSRKSYGKRWSNVLVSVILLLYFLTPLFTQGQDTSGKENVVQDLRGTVIDQSLRQPLTGASIQLVGFKKTVMADQQGNFIFINIPIGVYTIVVTHVGYKPAVIDNINHNAGKQTVLTVPMESSSEAAGEVVVQSISKKNKPLNDMSQVSARAFTVEETQKYAAAVNDPLRMAQAFPGVLTINDGKNDVAIRGNAPGGLLWRMEGVDIPNPNHFSSIGSRGGDISILSAQLLSNSDFLTGAFPADYGNALSSVFDLHLRKGNDEKNEYTLQAGLLGLDLAAEGPFNREHQSSYLVDYRYSTLAILNKLGINLYKGSSNFQDLSFNLYFPTKKSGVFTLFGFGGLSSNGTLPILDTTAWTISPNSRTGSRFTSNTGVSGLTHTIYLSKNSTLKSAISFSYKGLLNGNDYVQDDYSIKNIYRDDYVTRKGTLTSTFNHKFYSTSEIRFGATWNSIGFNYYKAYAATPNDPTVQQINASGNTSSIQAFGEWQLRTLKNLVLTAGIHYLEFAYNQTNSIEPRASVKWNFRSNSSLAFAYGLHSQIQPLGVYFAETHNQQGGDINPNHNLDLSKAVHYVLSWQQGLNENLNVKIELYYQKLYHVPISLTDSTLSLLNQDENYITDPLVNQGKGKNYGVEVSLDKHLSNHIYYLLNISIYQSKYTAADGIERNTRFNGNYLNNLVIGKEFVSTDKSKTFGINLKIIYAGGLRTIPIDINKSQQYGYTYFIEKEAYSQQNPPYFRTDLRLSMKWNRSRRTNTLSLDVQNLTNRSNLLNQEYIPVIQRIFNNYQNGIIPVINYKVEI